MRGAQLWPAFAIVTALEMLLLHRLPLAGERTSLPGALLLAGCLNIIAVALVGGLGGVALRRLRPDLPKVVADNYAGTAALGAVALVFVAVGLVHRPEIAGERAEFAEQSLAVRGWVQVHGDAVSRAHVSAATTVRIEARLYRTCVPGTDPRRWLCLIVETAPSPAHVTQDPSQESNAVWNPRGSFR